MFDNTPLILVEDDQALAQVVDRLSRARVIGIDTESDSFYHYQEKVCLIQVSDLETDYIIDPLAVGDISSLGPLLADTSIVKVLHGGDYDVVCLRRDYGFQIRNIFDTLIAAQLIGLERIGLADLIDRYFGVKPDKAFQRYDWARRPLKPEHIDYARGDTHYLLALREIMTRALRKIGRLRHQREECALLAERQWQGKVFDPDGYLRMKGTNTLDDESLRILRRLWLYRDEQARSLDRPAFKVFPDSAMVQVAKARPGSDQDLDGLFSRKSSMKRRHGKGMLRAVRLGLEDDFQIPKKKKAKPVKPARKGPRARLRGRVLERVFGDLKVWRNNVVDRDRKRTAFSVASNAVLKEIAKVRPTSLDEMSAIPEVRRWQVTDFGEELLGLLDDLSPLNS